MFQSNLKLKDPKPAATNQDLNRLLAYLRGKEDWSTAKTITRELGFNDRKIRRLANESEGHILSAPGRPGYKHILNAEPHQIAEVTSRLKKQTDAMLQRIISIHTAYHKAPYSSK